MSEPEASGLLPAFEELRPTLDAQWLAVIDKCRRQLVRGPGLPRGHLDVREKTEHSGSGQVVEV